jgi:hypothetical protein
MQILSQDVQCPDRYAARPTADEGQVARTDDRSARRAVAHPSIGVTHRPINLSAGIRVIAGVYHVQNVNAYDSRLKDWMRRFKGVSTRHLDSYLGWFRAIDRTRGGSLQPASLLALAVRV